MNQTVEYVQAQIEKVAHGPNFEKNTERNEKNSEELTQQPNSRCDAENSMGFPHMGT